MLRIMTSILRWIVAAALVIGSLIILLALIDGELGYTRARGLVSLAVIVFGGSLVVVDLSFPDADRPVAFNELQTSTDTTSPQANERLRVTGAWTLIAAWWLINPREKVFV